MLQEMESIYQPWTSLGVIFLRMCHIWSKKNCSEDPYVHNSHILQCLLVDYMHENLIDFCLEFCTSKRKRLPWGTLDEANQSRECGKPERDTGLAWNFNECWNLWPFVQMKRDFMICNLVFYKYLNLHLPVGGGRKESRLIYILISIVWSFVSWHFIEFL